MYKMVIAPDPILINPSEPVTKFDKKLSEIIKGMKETLDATSDPVGVGLAAPQVGINKRIFLSKPREDGPTLVIINPEIIEESLDKSVPEYINSKKVEQMKQKISSKGRSASGRKGRLLEGCLSVPNIWGNVERKKEVKLKYQDEKGLEHVKSFKGFPAIIMQHELDHLNGVLFTKHVLSQGETLYKSYKNDKGEDEFEELKV